MIKSKFVKEHIALRRAFKVMRAKTKGEDIRFLNKALTRHKRFTAYSKVGRHRQLSKLLGRKDVFVRWLFNCLSAPL